MAMSLNKAQLIGNLTRDPEVRQTPNGTTVATFSIATNFTWKDQSGQKQEKSEFHNIVAWGKLAEICGQYLNKGKKVYIEGRIQTRDWEGDDGVKRYKTEITAENMIMLGGRGEESSSSTYNQDRNQQSLNKQEEEPSSQTPVSANAEEITIDDLPF
jgi:single-strand DNA-binding protein